MPQPIFDARPIEFETSRLNRRVHSFWSSPLPKLRLRKGCATEGVDMDHRYGSTCAIDLVF